MPQEVFRQGNFTNGELDPQMLGRRELKAYFASLMGAENCIPTPQGPIARRPGLAYVGPIRNPMAPVDASGAVLSAPNGGDTSGVLGGAPAASFIVGKIEGVTLTIYSAVVGAVAIGQIITDDAGLIPGGTVIVGGAGSSWTISQSANCPKEPMSCFAPGPVSTVGMSNTDPYVFLEIDFGTPTRISALDIVNVAVIPAGGAGGDGSGGYTPPPPIKLPYGGGGGFNGGFFP
jgi:hypothetical protein